MVKRRGDPADRGAAPDCCRIVNRLVPQRGRAALSRASCLNTSAGSTTNDVGGTARRKKRTGGGTGGSTAPAQGGKN